MKGTGLKVVLILFDVLLLVVLAGGVYYSFFAKKVSLEMPTVLENQNLLTSRSNPVSIGLKPPDIERIAKMLSPVKIEKVEPTENTTATDTPGEQTEIDNLVVNGVILDNSTPEDSMAALFDKETKEAVNLFLGEEYKGWKLKQIIDRVTVLLERNGEEKTIRKTDEKIAMLTGGMNPNNPNQPGRPNQPNMPYNPNNPNNVPGKINDPRTANPNAPTRTSNITRNIRREFIKELASGYDQRMQEIYAKPFVVNGRSIGMQVSRIEQKSPLMAFGIQQGDIIKSWNGIPITSERQALEIAAKYRSNVDAIPASNEVVIIRGGNEIRMNIQLR